MRITIPFYKYQGTGNDFVIIHNNEEWLTLPLSQLAKKLCARKFGIGADGLIVLRNHSEYDFEIVYFNADGSQSLCGNGSRCAMHLAQRLGMIEQKGKFLAADGFHYGHIKKDDICIKMHDVHTIKRVAGGYFTHNGSPHYVKFVDNLAQLVVLQAGSAIRNSPPFQQEGTNVNFAQYQEENMFFVRTYERGVEDETLSCGTGAAAVALVAAQQGYQSPININTRGGKLKVHFERMPDNSFQEVYLEGPVEMVFQGTYEHELGKVL